MIVYIKSLDALDAETSVLMQKNTLFALELDSVREDTRMFYGNPDMKSYRCILDGSIFNPFSKKGQDELSGLLNEKVHCGGVEYSRETYMAILKSPSTSYEVAAAEFTQKLLVYLNYDAVYISMKDRQFILLLRSSFIQVLDSLGCTIFMA